MGRNKISAFVTAGGFAPALRGGATLGALLIIAGACGGGGDDDDTTPSGGGGGSTPVGGGASGSTPVAGGSGTTVAGMSGGGAGTTAGMSGGGSGTGRSGSGGSTAGSAGSEPPLPTSCDTRMGEPEGTCKDSANGTFAIKTVVDVWWAQETATPIVDPGRGQITV